MTQSLKLRLDSKLLLPGKIPLILDNVVVAPTGELVSAMVINGAWPLANRNGFFVCPVGDSQGIEVAPANSGNLFVIPDDMSNQLYSDVIRQFQADPKRFTPLAVLFTKPTSGEVSVELTITIPGKDGLEARGNLSWILRGFLGGVIETYEGGDPHREQAYELTTNLINAISDPKLREGLLSDCSGLLHDI